MVLKTKQYEKMLPDENTIKDIAGWKLHKRHDYTKMKYKDKNDLKDITRWNTQNGGLDCGGKERFSQLYTVRAGSADHNRARLRTKKGLVCYFPTDWKGPTLSQY